MKRTVSGGPSPTAVTLWPSTTVEKAEEEPTVEDWATVERSVVLHNTRIGPRAVVRDAILDKNVVVPEGVEVGVNKDHDRARGFAVSAGGVTVVGKGQQVTP